MACFCAFWALYFVCIMIIARKVFNFLPEEAISWTLKTYFWEVLNTLSASLGSYAVYCIVMQTICCLKFWNVTKSGGQFALAPPLQILETRPPLLPRNLRPWWKGQKSISQNQRMQKCTLCDQLDAPGRISVIISPTQMLSNVGSVSH